MSRVNLTTDLVAKNIRDQKDQLIAQELQNPSQEAVALTSVTGPEIVEKATRPEQDSSFGGFLKSLTSPALTSGQTTQVARSEDPAAALQLAKQQAIGSREPAGFKPGSTPQAPAIEPPKQLSVTKDKKKVSEQLKDQGAKDLTVDLISAAELLQEEGLAGFDDVEEALKKAEMELSGQQPHGVNQVTMGLLPAAIGGVLGGIFGGRGAALSAGAAGAEFGSARLQKEQERARAQAKEIRAGRLKTDLEKAKARKDLTETVMKSVILTSAAGGDVKRLIDSFRLGKLGLEQEERISEMRRGKVINRVTGKPYTFTKGTKGSGQLFDSIVDKISDFSSLLNESSQIFDDASLLDTTRLTKNFTDIQQFKEAFIGDLTDRDITGVLALFERKAQLARIDTPDKLTSWIKQFGTENMRKSLRGLVAAQTLRRLQKLHGRKIDVIQAIHDKDINIPPNIMQSLQEITREGTPFSKTWNDIMSSTRWKPKKKR